MNIASPCALSLSLSLSECNFEILCVCGHVCRKKEKWSHNFFNLPPLLLLSGVSWSVVNEADERVAGGRKLHLPPFSLSLSLSLSLSIFLCCYLPIYRWVLALSSLSLSLSFSLRISLLAIYQYTNEYMLSLLSLSFSLHISLLLSTNIL